jgi:hypothetical protein
LHEAISGKSADLSNLVLVTGYTLWDLVSYSLEYLMGGIYTQPDGPNAERSRKRFVETGQRFYPTLKMEGGYSIYRPILRYNTHDVGRIIRAASIPILSIPCRYANVRPKRMLERYYKSMQLHFDYSSVLEFAMDRLEVPSLKDYESMSDEHFLKYIF